MTAISKKVEGAGFSNLKTICAPAYVHSTYYHSKSQLVWLSNAQFRQGGRKIGYDQDQENTDEKGAPTRMKINKNEN